MTIGSKNLRADARRNYDTLIKTAVNMLALPGASFSFNELAKRAGVGVGTLYRHFPSKQTLLEVIYADKITALSDTLFAKLPADKALEQWLEKLIDFSIHSPGFDILITEAIDETKSPLRTSGSALLETAQKANLLRSDVDMQELLGLIRGITNASGVEHVNRMFSVVMAGLKK